MLAGIQFFSGLSRDLLNNPNEISGLWSNLLCARRLNDQGPRHPVHDLQRSGAVPVWVIPERSRRMKFGQPDAVGGLCRWLYLQKRIVRTATRGNMESVGMQVGRVEAMRSIRMPVSAI